MQLVDRNELFSKENLNFNFVEPPFDPIEFAHKIVKFAYDNNTICVSGNQVGVNYKVFAITGYPENFVCFNPKIVWKSEKEIVLEETSLTFKGLYVKVKRSDEIRCRFNTPNGDVETRTFKGMTARTFQHCMDFLDRTWFYNRANVYHREQAFKRWEKNK